MGNGRIYYSKESSCEELFRRKGPFWHLCTPGTNQEIIFTGPEDMKAALSILALTAIEFNLRIYTVCLMNNHIHIILACEESVGLAFFAAFRYRLSRYLSNSGRVVCLLNFTVKGLIPIESLEQLRQEIVYVNRNGYVANRRFNPFSYPYGAGCLYFNEICGMWDGVPLKSLTTREQRKILHGRCREIGCDLLVKDGMILPASYCLVKEGESFFRDNWHYFSMLSKNYEAYSLVAKRVSDTAFLTDEEAYPAVKNFCMSRYNVKQPKLLSQDDKREMIVYMHNELASTNDQIRRILNVDISLINELFPMSA